MTDIKTWLETTGLPVAETCFRNAVKLPFIVFLKDDDYTDRGSDLYNDLNDCSISVELYTSSAKEYKLNEIKIEQLLNEENLKFKKSRTWVESEKCFETIYDFSFLERNDV